MVTGALSDRAVMDAALSEAINDEYRARASYTAAIGKFGPHPPFISILAAEGRHIAALVPLFHRYGLPVPPDNWFGNMAIPDTITGMCQAGISAEIANYQMYDRLMSVTNDPAVLEVFSHLRSASHDHHLPAFESCSGTGSTIAAAAPASARNGMTAWAALAAGVAAGIAVVRTIRRS